MGRNSFFHGLLLSCYGTAVLLCTAFSDVHSRWRRTAYQEMGRELHVVRLNEKRLGWCRGPESNWLRPPFQGGALPMSYPGTLESVNFRVARILCQIGRAARIFTDP